jgi:DNA-binding response OmpR family regulator
MSVYPQAYGRQTAVNGAVHSADDVRPSPNGRPLALDKQLRQLVHRLRSKIEPDPASPIYIETVAGLGYGLVNFG